MATSRDVRRQADRHRRAARALDGPARIEQERAAQALDYEAMRLEADEQRADREARDRRAREEADRRHRDNLAREAREAEQMQATMQRIQDAQRSTREALDRHRAGR